MCEIAPGFLSRHRARPSSSSSAPQKGRAERRGHGDPRTLAPHGTKAVRITKPQVRRKPSASRARCFRPAPHDPRWPACSVSLHGKSPPFDQSPQHLAAGHRCTALHRGLFRDAQPARRDPAACAAAEGVRLGTPPAATASRPASVTCATPLQMGRDDIRSDWPIWLNYDYIPNREKAAGSRENQAERAFLAGRRQPCTSMEASPHEAIPFTPLGFSAFAR